MGAETTLESSIQACSGTYVFLILRDMTLPRKNDCSTKCLHKKIFMLLSRFLSSTGELGKRAPTTNDCLHELVTCRAI